MRRKQAMKHMDEAMKKVLHTCYARLHLFSNYDIAARSRYYIQRPASVGNTISSGYKSQY